MMSGNWGSVSGTGGGTGKPLSCFASQRQCLTNARPCFDNSSATFQYAAQAALASSVTGQAGPTTGSPRDLPSLLAIFFAVASLALVARFMLPTGRSRYDGYV